MMKAKPSHFIIHNSPFIILHQVTLANTSETITMQADTAGKKLPARAARPPMVGHHQRASSEIMNLGKKAIGNGTPPKTLLMMYQVPAELTKPAVTPSKTDSPSTRM